MPKQIRAVILCEDKQQEVFARTLLTTCGIRILRVQINPDPRKGSGEQYVRRNYPKEVKAFRTNYSAQPDTRLIVLIDADVRTVEGRLQQLEEALRENGLTIRQPQERIGVFVPKRNIETWIYFLQGQSVDEETTYPKFRRNESVCKPYVKTLAQNYHQPLPDHAPASLKTACGETARIFPEAG
jgi:hypothetical protein